MINIHNVIGCFHSNLHYGQTNSATVCYSVYPQC